MYRYSVDNAITYTPEDFVLFRESPFACWMERLTLENPDHGIVPDVGSRPPGNTTERQDDLAETLRAEGKDVALVDWDADEPLRRSATLEAMRRGADFIVNGQLALGPLSGTANLLMRTSGYSELGDYLYIPCETQDTSPRSAAFRLCFLADLLHSLQGQLPPQLLLIRGDSDLVPLPTDDHIYHYRAVKQRFMDTMRNFRKHRMPDPAESAHFGRWSDCANEVLKQRALRTEEREEPVAVELEAPLRRAAGAGYSSGVPRGLDLLLGTSAVAKPAKPAPPTAESTATGATLAEQARLLKPGTYVIGRPRSPVLAGRFADMPPEPPRAVQSDTGSQRGADAALQNLEFIGSSQRGHSIGLESPASEVPAAADEAVLTSSAPPPSLRVSATAGRTPQPAPEEVPRVQEQAEPVPDTALPATAPGRPPVSPRLRPLNEPPGAGTRLSSVIDMDSAPTVTPVASPGKAPADVAAHRGDHDEQDRVGATTAADGHGTELRRPPPFSNLITSTEFDE